MGSYAWRRSSIIAGDIWLRFARRIVFRIVRTQFETRSKNHGWVCTCRFDTVEVWKKTEIDEMMECNLRMCAYAIRNSPCHYWLYFADAIYNNWLIFLQVCVIWPGLYVAKEKVKQTLSKKLEKLTIVFSSKKYPVRRNSTERWKVSRKTTSAPIVFLRTKISLTENLFSNASIAFPKVSHRIGHLIRLQCMCICVCAWR